MLSDLELVLKHKNGQTGIFAELYDRYVDKIYQFVYYKTNHRETAEDLVSLVFIKAVKNFDNFNIDGGSFQAWLYKIARNTVIDHYRSYRQELSIDDIWDLPSPSQTDIDLEAKLKVEKIEKYLKELKTEHREILIMKIWQGLTYQEISEILGKSEASCKMALSRSLKQLREKMPLDLLIFLLLFGIKNV
jgi:RNA polymerase sigma-70 factor, ECF subfamily